MDIDVQVPLRTTTAYEFTCELRPRRSLRQRLSRHRGDVPTGSSELRFGYHATNFEIEHHDAWDGFYALYFLTRNGGPLFARGYDRAHIRLHFPVATVVRRFFIRRAADFGIDITVEAPTAPLRLDRPTRGHVLAFGGGKDSRLILGLLHESGVEPEVITSMPARASDIPAALVTKSVHGAIADRLMPGLMRLPRHFYYGGGLGEVQLRTPWQQHYDIASRTGRDQLAGLLATLGAEIEVHAPTVVLPANLAQRILYERYPELFAGQQSTRPEAQSNKNLHVALIRMLHGLPLQDGMDAALFGRLLQGFVAGQLADPPEFGYRGSYETPAREMRAIIWRLRDREDLATIRDTIRPDWDAHWIDYVHDYVDTGMDPAMVDLFARHAPLVSKADPGLAIRRIQT